MTKKLLLLTLIITLILSFSLTSYAKSTQYDDTKYQEIDQYVNSFQIEGGKALYCGSVKTMELIDVKLSASLQRYVNGEWVSIYTKTDRDIREAWVAMERYILKGYKYRVVSTCYYYDGEQAIEEDNWTSKEINY